MKTRCIVTAALLLGICSLSCAHAGSASAVVCWKIKKPARETGNFNAGCTAAGTEWIKGIIREEWKTGVDEYCAFIEAANRTGVTAYTSLAECKIEGGGIGSEYARITTEPPLIVPNANANPTLKATLGASTLAASTGETLSCTEGAGAGEVSGLQTFNAISITFKGCKGKSSSGTCTAKSAGAKEGEVVTHTLKGELGTVKASEASSGIGLLLEPTAGSSFTTIQGECLTEAVVTGSIAAEVTPVNTASSTGKLVFVGGGGSQSIKTVYVLGKSVSPALTAFSGLVTASEDTTASVTFSEAIEVI
jgi:hypothetical protein